MVGTVGRRVRPGSARWRRNVVALVGAVVAWQAAQANVFVADRREQRDPRLPIHRSVGVLHHPGIGVGGTAFLVGRCHVVTAHHVAFAQDRDGASTGVEVAAGTAGRTVEFLAGADPVVPGRFAASTRATVVAHGDFSDADFEGMAGDWAILRLDECLGRRYGFLRLARPAAGSAMPSGALMTLAFPRSRARQAGITVEEGCRARDHGPAEGLVGVDCAVERGMSGGPVLERQPDGAWLVVGLVQQSLGAVDGVLPAYTMPHRNQIVHVKAFQTALGNVLRAEAARAAASGPR